MKLLFAISAIVLATTAKNSILAQLKQLEHTKAPATKKISAADKANDKNPLKKAAPAKKIHKVAKKAPAEKKTAPTKKVTKSSKDSITK